MEDTVADVFVGVQTNIAGCAGFRSDLVTPAWKRRQNVRGKSGPSTRPADCVREGTDEHPRSNNA